MNPAKGESAMTNHLNHPTNTEHINGEVVPKPTLAQLGRQDSSETIDAKPKSTFKITSVTLHTQKGSSQDGRHSFGEEDEESAVDDSLVHTDAEPEDSPVPLASNFTDIGKQQQRQDRVDSTSRFKVVKIQKREPYTIGRWRISDFLSESEINSAKTAQDATHAKRSDSGNSSRASSTHYVHGVDDPAKNPLANISVTGNPPLPSIQQSPLTQPGLSMAVSAEPTAATNSSELPAANTHRPEYIDSNSKTAVNGDTVPSNKDPHLIGQQATVNQSVGASVQSTTTSRPTAATAAVAATSVAVAAGLPVHSSTSQQAPLPTDQTIASVNTQVRKIVILLEN